MNMKQNIAILLAQRGQRQNEKINGLPASGKGKIKKINGLPSAGKGKMKK